MRVCRRTPINAGLTRKAAGSAFAPQKALFYNQKGRTAMSKYYFIYYTEASVVCVIIFSIMLFRDLFNMDRQEKQIKYDHALIAFMLYFVCDACWAAVIAGILPKNHFTVLSTNFANYVLMATITYTWLRYVMAVEQVPNRDNPRTLFFILLPFNLATIALIATYLLKPSVLLNDHLELQLGYSAFQIAVPVIYIAAVLVYTLRRAFVEENPMERKKHLFVGFFPMMVIVGGLFQILVLPETPIFCFCCAILMLVFYINAMQTQISTDPLTSLNNRGQLVHYTMQKSNLHMEGRRTFVVMFDINDFKAINDNYGHAEGDRALVIVADALKSVVKRHNAPAFLARYGGDEFILISHPAADEGVEPLIAEIRERINAKCREENTPYALLIGAGYDEITSPDDSFQRCMERADDKLYLDKARLKGSHGAAHA